VIISLQDNNKLVLIMRMQWTSCAVETGVICRALEEKLVIWEQFLRLNYCDTIQEPNDCSNNGKLGCKKNENLHVY
jgi:hypothetical protein